MRLSKTQIGVITALNIVIAALVAVILIVPTRVPDASGADTPVDAPTSEPPTPDGPPAHDKYRAASKGLVDAIERETRLMGNGDETAVKTYFNGGKTYIFGNATVDGLDFDSYGGFVCVTDGEGRIESFSYFEGNITATCVMPSGYAVGAGGRVYTCDYAGKTALKLDAGAQIVGLMPTESGAAVVTMPETTALCYTEYSAGESWTAGRSTRIDSGYTLKYFDCYDFGDRRVIAARAHSLPRYDSLALYTFEPGGDAAVVYYGGTGDGIVRPYAVMPYADGYLAVATKNGVATLMGVEYSFRSYHEYSLGFTADDARLFYSGGLHYACFERADGAVTYEIDANLSRRRVTELDGLSTDRIVKTDAGATLAVGGITENGSTGISRVGIAAVALGSGKTISLDITGGSVSALSADGATLVLSARGGAALSTPTGADLYVVKLVPSA